MNGSKLPHPLRIIIFFLRLTLGLSFFYLGFSALFNAPLARELSARSLTDLYAWLGTAATATPLATFFAWAFLVIGACLILGLLMRVMAIAGIALTLVGYWPALISAGGLYGSQLVNDEVLVIACLLVLIFSNAGSYLGVDKFIHIHFSARHKK